MDDYQNELKELILTTAKADASDLHLTVGRHPTLRVSGSLTPLTKKSILTPKDTEGFVSAMLSEENWKRLGQDKEFDFSYSLEDRVRLRCNVFYQRGFLGASFRLIPSKIKTLEELNLPPILSDFVQKQQGFFLVVGPTGHGKSTTLASLVDIINHERNEHVITIEDPVEYMFVQDKAIVDQREIGKDANDFHRALRSMFRQDVDVAMIGEMRDHETMAAAVTAAETGHLILSSLHTNNAAQTIDRIIDSFPAAQQNQIRSQLSSTLLGIVSQRLIPRISGGLIPAYELLIANSAVRNLIRDNRNHEINTVIETNLDQGMVTFNRSLVELIQKGEITMDSAVSYSLNPKELQSLLE